MHTVGSSLCNWDVQQNRKLVRRMAAMAGGGREVDAGSEDDSEVFDDLFLSEGLHEANLRAKRMEPYLMCVLAHFHCYLMF